MELAFLSAVEQARLVRGGEVSSVELVELYLDRIERLDPELNAFVTVCADEALQPPRRPRRDTRRRAVPRSPDRGQGSRRDRRHPDDVLLTRLRRLRPGLRHRGRATPPRGGLRDRREDEHAGVRHRRIHGVGAERGDPEPVEHASSRPAARAAALRRRWPRGSCRSLTERTEAARSASQRRAAASSG